MSAPEFPAVPAVWVNRFSVTYTNEVTRISFSESTWGVGATTQERAAVVLSNADATALAELILQLKSTHEKTQT